MCGIFNNVIAFQLHTCYKPDFGIISIYLCQQIIKVALCGL